MDIRFTHFMYVPFTGLGLYHGFRGNSWLKNRIEVFKAYTLPSLINQNTRSFYVWMSWRPEERENPLVVEFRSFLDQIRDVSFIHTFGGVCFWDDKYDDETASQRLLTSLKESLPALKDAVGDTPYVIMTIQPSDDMYFHNAVTRIQDELRAIIESGKVLSGFVIGWSKGYIMNYLTKEVAEYSTHGLVTDDVSTYRTDTTPPFFSILFPKGLFLDPEGHYKLTGPYKSHEYIGDHLPFQAFKDRGFIVGTHGENISTTFHHRYRGPTLSKEDQEKILIKAGVFFSEPLKIQKEPTRRFAKKLLNKLPQSLRNKIVERYSGKEVAKQIKNYHYHNI